MGIFSRFKDIATANISSMLDRAEDPEKMIRLMIREMEETLVEIKAACAGTMATAKRIGREMDEVNTRVALWDNRAELAVDKGREELAREALMEKRAMSERADALEAEMAGAEALVDQARADIAQLEDKLETAKEKQRMLIQRHKRADARRSAQTSVRAAAGADAVMRFEKYEQRIERLEAEAGLVNPARPKNGGAMTLEDEFRKLEGDSVDAELAALKQRMADKSGGAAADGGPAANAKTKTASGAGRK